MTRPPLEVADLVRTAGTSFIERNCQWLRWTHIKVLLAIVRCRNAALGGHIDACMHADTALPSRITVAAIAIARSVRPALGNAGSRHVAANFCPRPTSMWFSLCLRNWLRWLCRTRKSSMVCCFAPAQKTLLEVARNPRHLGAEIGFFSVLHTWNQKLQLHPHVHCVIPAGGLSLDRTRWIRSRPRFFLHPSAPARVSR